MTSTKYCKVCGFTLADNLLPICDCCGTQAGYEDLSPVKIRERRETWIQNGMPWFNEACRPPLWNPEEQLKNSFRS